MVTTSVPVAVPGGAVLAAVDLEVRYPGSDLTALPALRLVALEIGPGRSLALVGESGSGKTTALRALLGLIRPVAGAATFEGTPVLALRGEGLRAFRRAVQLIPQDVDGALDPRQTIGSAIGEGWRAGGRVRGRPGETPGPGVPRRGGRGGAPRRGGPARGRSPAVIPTRSRVASGSAPSWREPWPSAPASSSSTSPRVAWTRRSRRASSSSSSACGPTVAWASCSSATTLASWRVSVRTTLVLYRGEVVETGATAELLARPRHPYTAALRRSVPEVGLPFRVPWEPSPEAAAVSPLTGCRFGPRCPHARAGPCAERQVLAPLATGGRAVRCIRTAELGVLEPLE